jgi:ketosteroid isomerase-like protein
MLLDVSRTIVPTLMTTSLTPETIRAEVARFWNAFTSKSAETLEELYAHESSCFGSASQRPEPGRLAATRRQREYFAPAAILRSQLGMVDVIMLGEASGVASYTFQFHATKVSSAGGRAMEEHITHGRATQVFSLDQDGVLRIVHEHFSLPQ